MSTKYAVSFDEQIDWFLGMKFNWSTTNDCVKYHVDQEAFILDLVDKCKLTNCNKSTRATSFRRGLPVDNLKPSTLPE